MHPPRVLTPRSNSSNMRLADFAPSTTTESASFSSAASSIYTQSFIKLAEERILKAGDTLMAPRDIPHQLRNSGNTENHYLLIFSPSGFEGFLKGTAVPAPANAVAPTKPPAVAVRNVHELATDYGILFG